MYVVTDISVYCYGRGMRPEADKHLAVPHKIVGATPMRMHLLLACEAGIVYSVKNKAYKQLESPHTADIIDIDAFDEQAVLCDERSLVSLWQTDEFGVMCTHTISCNAVKVVQCLHCVVVTEPNEIVSVWDVETQQCFVSWESPGISGAHPTRWHFVSVCSHRYGHRRARFGEAVGRTSGTRSSSHGARFPEVARGPLGKV